MTRHELLTPDGVYAELRRTGRATLPYGWQRSEQQTIARAVRRLAHADGLTLAQHAQPVTPGPVAYRGHSAMTLQLLAADRSTVVAPDGDL